MPVSFVTDRLRMQWVVRNFSGLHDTEKEWSERFEVAGSKWCVDSTRKCMNHL